MLTLALSYDTDLAGIIFVLALACFVVAAVVFGRAALASLLVAAGLGACAFVWAWQQFAAS